MQRLGIIFCALMLGLVGCEKLGIAKLGKTSTERPTQKDVSVTPPVNGTIIAKVDGYPYTLEDLNEEIETYNKLVSETKPEMKITTRDQKINYLKNDIVRRLLLYREALSRGLDKNENVLKALEKTKMELLIMELVRQEADKVEVSSKEIEDYYNAYKDQLKEPEERRIREIVVSTEQEARNLLIQILQGADFASLAKDYSKAASAKDGGDLGYLKPGTKSAQFDIVAFSSSLEKGQVSNIFKTPEGYCIVKIEDIRGGKQKTLSEMWDDIKRALLFVKQQQRLEEIIGKLSREKKIEIYESAIK